MEQSLSDLQRREPLVQMLWQEALFLRRVLEKQVVGATAVLDLPTGRIKSTRERLATPGLNDKDRLALLAISVLNDDITSPDNPMSTLAENAFAGKKDIKDEDIPLEGESWIPEGDSKERPESNNNDNAATAAAQTKVDSITSAALAGAQAGAAAAAQGEKIKVSRAQSIVAPPVAAKSSPWGVAVDKSNGQFYFWHRVNHTVQWERPADFIEASTASLTPKSTASPTSATAATAAGGVAKGAEGADAAVTGGSGVIKLHPKKIKAGDTVSDDVAGAMSGASELLAIDAANAQAASRSPSPSPSPTASSFPAPAPAPASATGSAPVSSSQEAVSSSSSSSPSSSSSSSLAPPAGLAPLVPPSSSLPPPPGMSSPTSALPPPPGMTSSPGSSLPPPPGMSSPGSSLPPPPGMAAPGSSLPPPPGMTSPGSSLPPPPGMTSPGSSLPPPPGMGGSLPPPPGGLLPPPPGGLPPPPGGLPPPPGGLPPPPGGLPPPMAAPMAPPGPQPYKPMIKPKQKMKPLHWKAILVGKKSERKDAAKDSLWAAIEDLHDKMAKTIDVDDLERKFASMPSKGAGKFGASADAGESKAGSSAESDNGPRRLLDPKRYNQLSIMMAQMPDVETITYALIHLNAAKLPLDKLDALHKALPTSEEVSLVVESGIAPDKLLRPERFILELSKIPQLAARIDCWRFMQHFEEQFTEVHKPLARMGTACDQVRNSTAWRRIMAVTLVAGNYLNGGTPRGQADGFPIDTLTKLGRVKDQDQNSSLLDHIVNICITQFGEDFPKVLAEELNMVGEIKGQSLKTLSSEGRKLQGKNSLNLKMQSLVAAQITDPADAFETRMEKFNLMANERIELLEKTVKDVFQKFVNLIIFLEPDTSKMQAESMNTEEFFPIIDDFVTAVVKCHDDMKRRQEENESNKKKAAYLTDLKKALSVPRLKPAGGAPATGPKA